MSSSSAPPQPRRSARVRASSAGNSGDPSKSSTSGALRVKSQPVANGKGPVQLASVQFALRQPQARAAKRTVATAAPAVAARTKRAATVSADATSQVLAATAVSAARRAQDRIRL